MSIKIKALMLDAGYAAPELATRAQKLAELIVKDAADYFEVEYGKSELSGNDVARELNKHFGVKQ